MGQLLKLLGWTFGIYFVGFLVMAIWEKGMEHHWWFLLIIFFFSMIIVFNEE